jgi:hypothetical protein
MPKCWFKREVKKSRIDVYNDAGESIALPVFPPVHLADAGMCADHGAQAVDDEPAPTSPGVVSDGEHQFDGGLHEEVPTLSSLLRDVVTQALRRNESPLLWVTADGREGHFMLQHPQGYHLTLRKFGFIGVRFVNLRDTQVLVSWCKGCPCGSTRTLDHLQGKDYPDSASDALFDEDVTHCMRMGWNAPSGSLRGCVRENPGSNPTAPEELQCFAVGLG